MRAWLRVGLCGALGGAINAGQYLLWVGTDTSCGYFCLGPSFEWHLVPAGAVHGGLLAALAFAGGSLLAKRRLAAKLLGVLLLGWFAGYASWIPLDRSLNGGSWPESLSWAFRSASLATLWLPFLYFGLVASIYCLCLALFAARKATLGANVLYASISGILGSLWFWISFGERWYYSVFSLLHGAIWGICVGVGAWMVSRPPIALRSSEDTD
jgi:hypothetical protein